MIIFRFKPFFFISLSILAGAWTYSMVKQQPIIGTDLDWVKINQSKTFSLKFDEGRNIHPSILALIKFQAKHHSTSGFVGSTKKVHHDGFLSAMSTKYNIPAWVNYEVLSSELMAPGKFNRRGNYPTDENFPKADSDYYTNTGYDHGHMAPARDFKHSYSEYRESNSMANIAPQDACLNQKGWCLIETLVRNWATLQPNATLFVSTGSFLNNDFLASVCIDSLPINNNEYIGVPAYFFKAFCIWDKTTNTIFSGAFLAPNSDVDNAEVKSMFLTIDELEKLTGLDFFCTWPKVLQDKMEQELPKLPFNIKSDCGKHECDKIYSKRPRPLYQRKN